jgi:cysteine desulfurase/selenocysteine lyase
VSFERTVYNELPYKFEAGTPHIAGAVGLGAAIDYVRAIGFDAIGAHEAALLAAMPPWQGGGDMILAVSFDKTIYNALPYKFEAGTPAIAEAVGLGTAIDYLESLGMERIAAAEHELLLYANERLATIPGLRFVGTAPEKAAVISFTLDKVHPHDLGTILDSEGVAIRTGHHCAMPVMEFYGLPATARASFAFYNTRAEIDRLVDALHTAREMLG